MQHVITPIGYIHSPFKEKFAVPRQPGLAPSASAKIEITDSNCDISAFRGIEQFSHLWLLFLFDQNLEKGWHPTVRPPRLGGNERIGVFASRATFRPNGIGMSAVQFKRVETQDHRIWLHLGSCDLVQGTPIIDIKPYIPYSDNVTNAYAGYASDTPVTLDVEFESQALSVLPSLTSEKRAVIKEVIAQDPRPAYKKNKVDTKIYAVHLYDFNVKFYVNNQQAFVCAIEPFGDLNSDC